MTAATVLGYNLWMSEETADVLVCPGACQYFANRGGGLAQILVISMPTSCFFSYLNRVSFVHSNHSYCSSI